MNRRLSRLVRLIADALYDEFDPGDPNRCMDVSQIAFRVLDHLGYSPLIIGASPDLLGVRTEDGHEWLRVDGWNVDFGAGQFGLPYPFVTKVNDLEAMRVYGHGSVEPSEEYEVGDRDSYHFHYPTVEQVLRTRDRRKLAAMGETPSMGPRLLRVARKVLVKQ